MAELTMEALDAFHSEINGLQLFFDPEQMDEDAPLAEIDEFARNYVADLEKAIRKFQL